MYRNWETLIKPKAFEVEEETLTSTYGRFHVEPLERGFGITIGNSLRRILLSSLQGAAITPASIKGVLHEFSTLPGVREDVTDIILNIKEILVKMHSPGPEILRLKVTKAGEVKAGDIEPNPNVEILNPDHHMATLSADGELEIEMVGEMGKGLCAGREESGGRAAHRHHSHRCPLLPHPQSQLQCHPHPRGPDDGL